MTNTLADAPSVIKYTLKCGVPMGLIGILFGLTIYFTKQSPNGLLGWFTFALMGVTDFFMVKNFRTRLHGKIAFGKAFLTAFLILLFGAAIYAVYDYIFFKYIAPQALDLLNRYAEQQLVNKGLSPEQVEAQMKFAQIIRSNAVLQIAYSILTSSIFNVVIALIVAAACKKEPQVAVAE